MPTSILLIPAALAFFALPLIPAIRELRKPQDCKALNVYQGNAADMQETLAAARSAKQANPFITAAELKSSYNVVELPSFSMSEVTAAAINGGTVAVKGISTLTDNVPGLATFVGDIVILEQNSAGYTFSVSATEAAYLSPNVVLASVEAPFIYIGDKHSANPRMDMPVAPKPSEAPSIEGASWQEIQGWWHGGGDVSLKENQVIKGDLIAAGDITLEDGTVVIGSIKSGGRLTIGKGCLVYGNCVAQNILIGHNSAIAGSVVADEAVTVYQKVLIGSHNCKASVLGRDILLHVGSTVHGAVLAHQQISTFNS